MRKEIFNKILRDHTQNILELLPDTELFFRKSSVEFAILSLLEQRLLDLRIDAYSRGMSAIKRVKER